VQEADEADARALANIDENVAAPKPCTGLMTQVEADMQALEERSVDVQGMTNFTVEVTQTLASLSHRTRVIICSRMLCDS
jgi:hypothetical protein